MFQQTANSRFINNSARCSHFYPNGRRCRLTATNANPNFCPAHAPPRKSARRGRNRLHPHRQPRRLHLRRSNQRLPLPPAPPPRARQNLHPPRRRPRLHHQPTPPYPAGNRQGGKFRRHDHHLRYARPRPRPPCPRPKSDATYLLTKQRHGARMKSLCRQADWAGTSLSSAWNPEKERPLESLIFLCSHAFTHGKKFPVLYPN